MEYGKNASICNGLEQFTPYEEILKVTWARVMPCSLFWPYNPRRILVKLIHGAAVFEIYLMPNV
jgi:hypothetical protein